MKRRGVVDNLSETSSIFALERDLANDQSGELRDKLVTKFADLDREIQALKRKGTDRNSYAKLEAASTAAQTCGDVIQKLWRKMHLDPA